MSDTTQFIADLRASAATLRTAAQALRIAMQAVQRPGPQGLRLGSAAGNQDGRTPSAPARIAAACLDGSCSVSATGRTPQSIIPASAISAALSGDFTRALQSVLRSVIGQLTRAITHGLSGGGAAATGLGGSLVSSLLGGGLSLLLGKLFGRLEGGTTGLRATGPLPLPALLSFPQLVLPGYASAPASALFGQRAVPRSPGINVSIEYKRGADDFVVAKVAQRLSELNNMENI